MTRSCFGLLLTIIILSHFYTSSTAAIAIIQRFHDEDKNLVSIAENLHSELESMEESVVYKALVVIEGDIMVDKFCSCETRKTCRDENRSVIRLTK